MNAYIIIHLIILGFGVVVNAVIGSLVIAWVTCQPTDELVNDIMEVCS